MAFAFHISSIVLFSLWIQKIASFSIPQGYNYGTINDESGNAIIALPEYAGYIISGDVYEVDKNMFAQIRAIRIDLAGVTQWTLDLGCPNDCDDFVADMALCKDQTAFVIIGIGVKDCIIDPEPIQVAVIYKVSLDGILQYKHQLITIAGFTPKAVKVDDNGFYILAGTLYMNGLPYGFAARVNEAGVCSFLSSHGNFLGFTDIDISDNDYIFAVGWYLNAGKYKAKVCYLFKTTGAQYTEFIEDRVEATCYNSVTKSRISNNYVVGGWTTQSGSKTGYIVVYTRNLIKLYSNVVNINSGEFLEIFNAEEMSNGNIIFTGYFSSTGHTTMYILITDEDANLINFGHDHYSIESFGQKIAINGEDGSFGFIGYINNRTINNQDFYFVHFEGCGDGMDFSKNDNTACGCRFGFAVIDSSNKCIADNTGQFSCRTIDACRDRRSNIGICNKKCTCNTDFYWDGIQLKCIGLNSGVPFCIEDANCKNQLPVGKCENNKCVCNVGYIYSPNYSTCKIKNDNTVLCNSISECIDFNTDRAICDVKCKCLDEAEYVNEKQRCLGYNNGKSTCHMITDCIDDNIYAAECSNYKCICKFKFVFDYSTKKCVCDKGYYAYLQAGTPDCKNCISGYYQDEIGRPECKKCPASTYNPYVTQIALSSCFPCPANSFSNEGYSKCTCNPGCYYKNIGVGFGSQYCQPCHSFCTKCLTVSFCYNCIDHPGIEKVGFMCKCKTNDGFYVKNISPNVDECLHCSKYCKQCENENKCNSCIDHPGIIMNANNACECKAPGFREYTNTTSTDFYNEICIKCDPLCFLCDNNDFTKCLACDSNKGAIFIEPSKCGCPQHFYYEITSDKCEECSPLCINCHGSGNNKCDECNFELSFNVQDLNELCVSDCNLIDGYYLNGKQCEKCNANCMNCIGPNQNQCTKCKDSSMFLFNGQCVLECPEHFYYNLDHICLECHSSCLNCTKAGINGCSSCPNNMYLYENSCVNICPDSSFLDYNSHKCIPCKSPCEKCLNENDCLTCVYGFYLNDLGSTKCVSKCESSKFQNEKTKICESCHFSCLTCAGPSKYECLECNFIEGFAKNIDKSSECFLKACESGFFRHINHEKKEAECLKCHDSCLNCLGPLNSDCIECKLSLKRMQTEIKNRVKCLSCSEFNPGFTNNHDLKCHEICGDGRNLGEFECDDGNLYNGDGCNQECKIEYGFKCVKRYNNPDFCYDYLEPTAKLKIISSNLAVIEFSEQIKIDIDSNDFIAHFINITIEFSKEPCIVQKFGNIQIPANSVISSIVINLDIQCTLRGGVEKFNLTFIKPDKITDLYGNHLTTKHLYANAKRFLYISESEKTTVEASGTVFSASSFLTFGLVIGMSLLQSTAVGSFWSFVNMLQLASYIPILKYEIPYNLQIFFTEYMSVSKVVFPFKLLPNFILNPLTLLKSFIAESIGDNFEICGYETFSFLWNFGEELITWIWLLAFYLLLNFLDNVLPENRFVFIRRWKKDYEFNTVIRVLIECYMNLVFCSFLNIWISHPTSVANQISLTAAILASFLSIGFLVVSFNLVETRRKERKSIKFKEKYETIIEDLKIGYKKSHFANRYYYPFFMIRRIFYAVVLITLINYPLIQIGIITLFIIGPMIFYLAYCMPFKQKVTNYLNIYNEITLLSCYFGILIIHFAEFSTNSSMICGWILISFVLISLLLSWIIMLPKTLKELLQSIKELIYGLNQQTQEQTQIQNSPNNIDFDKNTNKIEPQNSEIQDFNQSGLNLKNSQPVSRNVNPLNIEENSVSKTQ